MYSIIQARMIHVLGSINIDYSITVANLPKPGETITGHGMVLTPGGKGANQALAACRAGANVKMTGAVGTDISGATGCAFVFVDEQSENQIVIIAGANGAVTAEHARSMTLAAEDILLLQLECPVTTVVAAAAHARQKGAKTVANPAPYQSLDKQFFKDIDYMILNESEAEQLAEDLSLNAATVAEISAATDCAVIRTLGANGIEATDEQSAPFNLPGIQVEAVDTVGAGDTFAGFLATMLATGNSLQNACMVANAAAALACTRPGAQTAIPTMQDVVNFAQISTATVKD